MYKMPIGTVLRKLEEETKKKVSDIPVDDSKVLSLFSGCSGLGITPEQLKGKDIGYLGCIYFDNPFIVFNGLKAYSFSEILRLLGESHNTYYYENDENIDIDIRNNPISNREDIMNYLLASGMKREEAYNITRFVRMGKASIDRHKDKWDVLKKTMTQYHIPESYVSACEHFRYLFPKSHSAGFMLLGIRLMYYKK